MNAKIWLTGALMVALVCWAGTAQAGILVSEDFESYSGAATSWYSNSDNDPSSPWTIDESQQEVVQLMKSPLGGWPVFDTPYGSQYLHMWRDGSGTCFAWMSLSSAVQNEIAANGQLRMVVDAYNFSGVDGWNGAIGFSGWDSAPGSWTKRAFDVALYGDGHVVMYTGSGVQDDGINAAFDANTWERLTIDLDFVTDTWSLTIDNATKSGLTFESGDLSKIQYLLFAAWDAPSPGRGGFDNVTILSPIPEPSTIALLTAGLLGLLAYAWRRLK